MAASLMVGCSAVADSRFGLAEPVAPWWPSASPAAEHRPHAQGNGRLGCTVQPAPYGQQAGVPSPEIPQRGAGWRAPWRGMP
eukprot:3387110-Pleurochrysis_carterae.AAC.1